MHREALQANVHRSNQTTMRVLVDRGQLQHCPESVIPREPQDGDQEYQADG
jgi:hypothetical protein